MIDSNAERLQRTTGRSATGWANAARDAGIATRESLSSWLRGLGVTGYNLLSIDGEMFGYPELFLQSADELYDGQYLDRPALRPIADRLLHWAQAADGVDIQMRKTYVSLQTPRRKFAQVTPTNRTTLDVFLRVELPDVAALEPVRAAGDPFAWRLRLREPDDVDDAVLDALTAARDDSR
ncbi:DUF5655 domain-containing protein [Arthrobacter sp. Br18]|uniref:DUF5655 domain-containing protein n=1 Tax=Arthrobacter sp. Br18 TaxID=1312954 RepID=UPI00047A4EE9|nr:DUF5655 domain-containing protein [Arthrobacter sp. Br18]